MRLSDNRIVKGELCLIFIDWFSEWRRVLFMANGTYVEVDLTARGGVQSWDQIRSINIRKHFAMRSSKDAQYRFVQQGSPVHDEVVELMSQHLSDGEIVALLHRDYLPEIDWAKWGIHKNHGGGVPYMEICKTNKVEA
jgi:hypothetical protein